MENDQLSRRLRTNRTGKAKNQQGHRKKNFERQDITHEQPPDKWKKVTTIMHRLTFMSTKIYFKPTRKGLNHSILPEKSAPVDKDQ
jgi:hypothetical protein